VRAGRDLRRVAIMTDYIEHKTPKGILIKLYPAKREFLAFDRNGSSLYADGHNLRLMHKAPSVFFLGERFHVKNTAGEDLSFVKISRGKLVIPYEFQDEKRYVFIARDEALDVLPVVVKCLRNFNLLANEVKIGRAPDYIIVDTAITRNDIIVIKNLCTAVQVIITGDKPIDADAPPQPGEGIDTTRATELIKDVNINMLSQNPVFLARVHLRRMDLAKVKQLLLDFDLAEIDAQYILNFVVTMIGKADRDPDLRRERATLELLSNSFRFYLNLLMKDDDAVRRMIQAEVNQNELVSYHTLIAKTKLLFPSSDDQLRLTEIENLIWEAMEKLKK